MEDVPENESLDSSVIESEVEHESLTKKARISREEAIEKLLNGLKEKLNSLPVNSPMRKTILTIAPDCWTVRDIAHEFGYSYRMAVQSKNSRESSGVLATPAFKKGKNLDEEVLSKVIEFYGSEENSRIMPNKKDTVIVKIEGQKVIKKSIYFFMILRCYTECLRKSMQSMKLDQLNSLSCGLNGALLLEV